MVKLHLVPAKDFVRLKYYLVKSFDEAVKLTEKKVGEGVNFVDGIIFTKDRGVIMTGNFSDESDLPLATFSKRTDDWFYIHVDKISKRHEIYEEIIPIKDYLFRYDRGAFWMGYYVFNYFKIPFTKLTRFLLERISKTRTLYHLAHATNMSQEYFVQDLSMPRDSVLEFMQFVDDELHIYPLWLCPLRPGRDDKFSPNTIKTDLVINVGVWGKVKGGYENFIRANRNVENKVWELGGRKVLYAHAYYPRDEFWKIYDNIWYNALREKYFANSVFPDIYDKVKVSEKYKSSIFIGLLKALRSRKIPVS